jgi:N-dimethylarginine dimethylaminohydrolase
MGELMKTSTASVQEALKDTEYPAEKRDLAEHARQHNASKDVLDDIKSLPDKVYTSAAAVNKEFEGE